MDLNAYSSYSYAFKAQSFTVDKIAGFVCNRGAAL